LQENNLLYIDKLNFSYHKDKVLQNISLHVQKGDFLAIIGPNGGGKSTLIKLILGLLKPSKGTIKLFQNNHMSNESIGYVPQNTNINTSFPIKVIDVILMNMPKNSFLGYSSKQKELALEVLKQVNMSKYAQSKIGSLSGGQRQRVMIARALSLKPTLLILDEPTSSIDIDGQREIYELLKELNKDITIIVVSHDIQVILKYASKVAHVNKELSFHDITKLQNAFNSNDEHFCEVELLELLGSQKCPSC
jgi:zinc transport system ATP-binding protein